MKCVGLWVVIENNTCPKLAVYLTGVQGRNSSPLDSNDFFSTFCKWHLEAYNFRLLLSTCTGTTNLYTAVLPLIILRQVTMPCENAGTKEQVIQLQDVI